MLAKAGRISSQKLSFWRILSRVAPILFVGVTLLALGKLSGARAATYCGAVITGLAYLVEIAMLVNGLRRLLPEDVITHTWKLLTYIEDKRDQWGMIQTQAAVNQRVESLAKQYRRLPLLLATGDAEEKVELERWGSALAVLTTDVGDGAR
jgi:hypothetical protein